MHRRLVRVAALGAWLAVASMAAAQTQPPLDPFSFLSPREKSMGGRHVAIADDFSVLLSNPAGLADMPKEFSAADLGIQAIGPVFDIANFVLGGTSQQAIENFLSENDYKLYAGLDISGPLAFGYTGDGLGFGLFNETSMNVNVASISSIGFDAREDILLAGGYALKFDLGRGNELAGGITAKGFVRGDVSKTMGILEAIGLASNLSSILDSPLTVTTGIGLDAGLRWNWKGILAAGLVCHDLYSPALVTTYSSASAFLSSVPGAPETDTVARSLDAGFMWSPPLGRLGQILDSLTVALDYKDILDLFNPVPRNPILNVGLGVETRVLDIVTLRAGISDALLSAGLGLNLSVFTINIAAYGSELGLDPGDRPYYNLLVDFDFKY